MKNNDYRQMQVLQQGVAQHIKTTSMRLPKQDGSSGG